MSDALSTLVVEEAPRMEFLCGLLQARAQRNYWKWRTQYEQVCLMIANDPEMGIDGLGFSAQFEIPPPPPEVAMLLGHGDTLTTPERTYTGPCVIYKDGNTEQLDVSYIERVEDEQDEA